METYQRLDPARALDLKIVRKGWFKPRYILTDDRFVYGILCCAEGGIFSKNKRIETAEGSWLIKPVGWLAKETQIINSLHDQLFGTVVRNNWDSKNTISLQNGLNAVLARDGGIFSNKVSWSNDQLGNFIQLKACFSFSKAFTVTLDNTVINKPIAVALLTLIAANIIIVRQAQAAA